ncbi:sulfite reductase [NADPH] hemoprotein beta-component [Prolixibacter sp. NT017]|nr:sulfite reductase [NADPH] hemoprotein beta-component [Prolixibacter sp. NT017]
MYINLKTKTMSEQINWDVLSELEKLKYDSNYLRGTLTESLADPITGAIAAADQQISKFHGIYQQQDRDLELERKKQKLEPAWSFLIRVRLPGGIATGEQWLTMDSLSDTHANSTLKLTTRQAFQLHGVFKRKLKSTIQGINRSLLDTIAACGDVNRNVMASPNPYGSKVHGEIQDIARQLSAHLLPQTPAYHEIWLDKKLVAGGQQEIEPLYGKRYLPRKFKIGIAIPPNNDTDIFSQDVGLIAIEENGKLAGFNVAVGGGMGSTFGRNDTYPRVGNVLGFATPDQVLDVVEKVVLIQRDNGNREDRKRARLKYTIDSHGLDWFVKELHERLGYELEAERSYTFTRNGDDYGWHENDGRWYYTLFIEGGRVKNTGTYQLKTALREVAKLGLCDFRLTGNQNLVLGDIAPQDKKKITDTLQHWGVIQEKLSGLRRNSIACVALNTCPLAFAEAERYLPSLITKIEKLLDEVGLFQDEIVIRMTGCPNGCGRPSLAEIGLIGKSLGHYNLYLGGGFSGERLNNLYRETLTEEEILETLRPLLKQYAEEREEGERFGDFVIRAGIVKEIKEGAEFRH